MRIANVWSMLMASLLVAGGLHVNLALGQQPAAPAAAAPVNYEVLPLPPSIWDGRPSDATIKLDRQVQQIIKGELSVADNASSFDAFFTRYYFPLMTQNSPEQLAKLHRQRNELARMYLNRPGTSSAEAHDRLVNLTFTTMKDIVKRNFHPAVRYNAMLIIAELNSKEGVTSGPQAGPAEPLPAARDFMIAELLDPKQIDAVKVAALIGILRHVDHDADRPAERKFASGVRNSMIKQILPLAADKKVPAGRDVEGHAWLRAREVEILTTLAEVGYDPQITQLLVQIVGDEAEPLSLRFVAAESLGNLDLTADANVAGGEVARKLGDLLLNSTRSQLSVMDEEIAIERERLRRENGGSVERGPRFPSGFAGNPNDPAELKKEQRILLERRILKDRAMRVLLGLRGTEGKTGALSAAKDAKQKTYVTNLVDAVTQLSKVADVAPGNVAAGTVAPRLPEFAKELRPNVNELDRVAKTGGAPKAVVVPKTETPEGPEVPGAEVPGADVPGAEVPGGEEPGAAAGPAAPPARGPAAPPRAPVPPPAGPDVPDLPDAGK